MAVMLSVTQLNTYIKSLIDGDMNLSSVFVTGEISNFTNHYRTGHLYFTLKDGECAVKAVMFRFAASRLRFLPENGMKVLVRGSVGVYERDGVYQIYVEDMQPDGAGALSIAFEQLKKKLEKKGYFDIERKRPLPEYPEKIAVVTSPTGAAVRDIFNILSRRFPYSEPVLFPVQVQGDSAPAQICEALEKINREKAADVIIVGRGGGSMEDLQAFNSECVADAIYESSLPVISAVGHETDFTIADFTADMRAPTPSAAAELAVPDERNVLSFIDTLQSRALSAVASSLGEMENRLLRQQRLLESLSVSERLSKQEKKLEALTASAQRSTERRLHAVSDRFSSLCAGLEALNPLKVLTRGYSLTTDAGGRHIRSVTQTAKGENLSVRVSDGIIDCTVERIRNNG